MVVLGTCKNDEDSIKNEGARVFTTRAAYSIICIGILPKFKVIQVFMHVLITFKNEEDPIKNEEARVATRLHVNFSDVQGQINS